jgi:hypothetical protein
MDKNFIGLVRKIYQPVTGLLKIEEYPTKCFLRVDDNSENSMILTAKPDSNWAASVQGELLSSQFYDPGYYHGAFNRDKDVCWEKIFNEEELKECNKYFGITQKIFEHGAVGKRYPARIDFKKGSDGLILENLKSFVDGYRIRKIYMPIYSEGSDIVKYVDLNIFLFLIFLLQSKLDNIWISYGFGGVIPISFTLNSDPLSSTVAFIHPTKLFD